MGKEHKEDVADFMEDALGLKDETIETEETPTKEVASSDPSEQKEEQKVPEATPSTATLVTQEQIGINKEIAKIDLQIEALESTVVDATAFYDNLENELSEEEQGLEFSDKSAYMKLVSKKAKEYEEKHSKKEDVQNLKSQKKELELVYERQGAITDVTAKYPDYNHEKVLNFYMNELSKSEQDKIVQASKSYQDVYENAYKKYIVTNPSNIHTTTVPNIPNVNNVRKQTVNNSSIDNGLTSHDDQLKQALGL
ncbi:MAG: hypothetical protein RQ763_00110 [Sulfurimonas sp.]|uniref:hypothetical protein n=1 Tax=Sulfurimonas sp. TaxID=2022749 RepID=UPI0028CE08A8|nr:hypothetical protein [Sulfurimonas sp.]MDT8337576.1 hypothetical protein [Sulfurimonas sp.]